jgi:hypothetical protein
MTDGWRPENSGYRPSIEWHTTSFANVVSFCLVKKSSPSKHQLLFSEMSILFHGLSFSFHPLRRDIDSRGFQSDWRNCVDALI